MASIGVMAVVEEIKDKLGANPVPLYLPIGKENDFEGIVDLLEGSELRFEPTTNGSSITRSELKGPMKELADKWYEKLIDDVSAFSEEITELFLEGKDIPSRLIKKALRKAALSREIVPVFVGASLKNIGVQPLLRRSYRFSPLPHRSSPSRATGSG